MLKIDSHQHYWTYHPVKDAWITDDMQVIQRDFLPGNVLPCMQENGISGCVAIQADQSEKENEFLLGLAGQHSFIKGIIGWIDLRANNLEERLQHYSKIKLMKGFRHILPGEPDDRFMLDEKFMRGIGLLSGYGFTYDVLINLRHLPYVPEFLAAFPNQRFVIDHLAKPFIKDKQLEEWKQNIEAVAAFPNVYCKVSGLTTEADWNNWTSDDFEPYLNVVFNTFGTHRLMFGSDWPVCNLAGGYNGVLAAIDKYIGRLSEHDKQLFWGKNSIEFYGLEV